MPSVRRHFNSIDSNLVEHLRNGGCISFSIEQKRSNIVVSIILLFMGSYLITKAIQPFIYKFSNKYACNPVMVINNYSTIRNVRRSIKY